MPELMNVILVGGLWLDGSVWEESLPHLEANGCHGVPVTLPGQGDANTAATLEDQVSAVLAAVDAAPGRVAVVGHSAACTLAWLAADARPDAVDVVILIGGFPCADGELYADFFPIQDGAMPFPGWEPFDGPDSADLDEQSKARIQAKAISVPERVARGVVHLSDERRLDVPVVLICPEFTPSQAREWIAAGDLPELARARHLELVDLDTGHWPMVSAPAALAAAIAAAAGGIAT